MTKYKWIFVWVLALMFTVAVDVTRDLINNGWFVGHMWRQTCLMMMWMLVGVLSYVLEEYWLAKRKK